MVIMNDLELSMILCDLFENFRNIMQQSDRIRHLRCAKYLFIYFFILYILIWSPGF